MAAAYKNVVYIFVQAAALERAVNFNTLLSDRATSELILYNKIAGCECSNVWIFDRHKNGRVMLQIDCLKM